MSRSINPRVTFITSSLNLGGAERQLLLLCNELKSFAELSIISLDAHGPLIEKYRIEFPNIKVIDLTTHISLKKLWKLRSLLKESNPDIVITWLYRADILGGLALKSFSNKPVIWSARNSAIPDLTMPKKLTLKILSWIIPSEIVANGLSAKKFHKQLGYPGLKFVDIPNLISLWASSLSSKSRLITRTGHINDIRVGIAARQVSGKGIQESINEINILKEKKPDIELLLIGQKTKESESWARLGLYGDYEVHQLISDEDLAKWFSELDLLLMPSTMWESQPNSLIEAISMNCPVLISDVVELEFQVPAFLHFNPKVHGDLATKLEQISKGNHYYRTIEYQKFCISILKNFDTKSVIDKWLKLIETHCK